MVTTTLSRVSTDSSSKSLWWSRGSPDRFRVVSRLGPRRSGVDVTRRPRDRPSFLLGLVLSVPPPGTLLRQSLLERLGAELIRGVVEPLKSFSCFVRSFLSHPSPGTPVYLGPGPRPSHLQKTLRSITVVRNSGRTQRVRVT